MELNTECVRNILEEQFPGLQPFEISYLGAGMDNQVYMVNQDWVFRFPKRIEALETLKKETFVLEILAAAGFQNIPRPQFYGRPGKGFPWPFLGYTPVKGKPAPCFDLQYRDHQQNLPEIALFLKNLHKVSLPSCQPLDSWPVNQELISERLEWFAGIRDRASQLNLAVPEWQINLLLDEIKNADFGKREPVLVHGDFYISHIMIGPGKEFTGVIDFGGTHLGDPAMDLALVYMLLPGDQQAPFWEVYGEKDRHTHLLARFFALYCCLNIQVYGTETSDYALAREGHKGISAIFS